MRLRRLNRCLVLAFLPGAYAELNASAQPMMSVPVPVKVDGQPVATSFCVVVPVERVNGAPEVMAAQERPVLRVAGQVTRALLNGDSQTFKAATEKGIGLRPLPNQGTPADRADRHFGFLRKAYEGVESAELTHAFDLGDLCMVYNLLKVSSGPDRFHHFVLLKTGDGVEYVTGWTTNPLMQVLSSAAWLDIKESKAGFAIKEAADAGVGVHEITVSDYFEGVKTVPIRIRFRGALPEWGRTISQQGQFLPADRGGDGRIDQVLGFYRNTVELWLKLTPADPFVDSAAYKSLRAQYTTASAARLDQMMAKAAWRDIEAQQKTGYGSQVVRFVLDADPVYYVFHATSETRPYRKVMYTTVVRQEGAYRITNLNQYSYDHTLLTWEPFQNRLCDFIEQQGKPSTASAPE